jgi:hypothetical protein
MPDGAPMDYAPENELGVVFLFSHLAKERFGLRIKRVLYGHPDCIAYSGTKEIRIEFEFKSSNFAERRSDATKCDWLVCWIHDWPTVPDRIRIIELREEFGFGFNVWLQPVAGDFSLAITKLKRERHRRAPTRCWSVPSQASEDDLLLFYRDRPEIHIRDIYRVVGPFEPTPSPEKSGKCRNAQISCVCAIGIPLRLDEIRNNRALAWSKFIRGSTRGCYRVTEYWPDLYEMIVARNPNLERVLRRFAPSRLA